MNFVPQISGGATKPNGKGSQEEGNAEVKLPPFDYILADKTKKILSILKDRATEDMHMMKHRTVAYTHKE